jgi:hypothetical protein
MISEILPLTYRKRLSSTVTILFSLFLSFGILSQNVYAQEKLTLTDISVGLKSKKTSLPERNRLLTNAVKTRGVTFVLTPEIEKELRAAGATTALITAIRQNGPTTTTTTTTTNRKPSATFKDIWVDYNVVESGAKGMRIHTKFTTYEMKNLPSYLAIYFLYDNEKPIKDKNGKFTSTAGDVAVYREMLPQYDPADFNDLTVFMPYSELDLPDGVWDLKMDVKLIYKQGGLIQNLTMYDFTYRQGNQTTTTNTSSVTAKANRIWVDYNVTEGGRRGMRIHVSFEVTGLQNIDSFLSVRVQYENGNYVRNTNPGYSNRDSQLQLAYALKPGYPTTVYNDVSVFLPYQEITVSRGVWNLKLDIDLMDRNRQLIQHLDFYDFEFERP